MSKHIVFIHGMWSGEWTFAEYSDFFSQQGYHCHRPILFGHEHNQPDSLQLHQLGQTSLLGYVQQLENYIAELDEKPILIGHSMGGLLVQMLAAKGLAEKVVLLCPAPPAKIHGLTLSVVRSFFGIMTRWGFWRKANKISFNAAKFALLNKIPAAQQQTFYNLLGYESGRAAFEIGFWLVDKHQASRVDFAQIDCPMLMLSGAQDHITPASVHLKVAQKYSQAEHKIYPDHAHWIMSEPGWQAVLNDVSQWLESTK